MFKKIAKIIGLTFCLVMCLFLFIAIIAAGTVILNWIGDILPVDVIGALFVIICGVIMFKLCISGVVNIISNW